MVKTFDKNAQRMKRHTRVRGKISGTPERPRLNVFRSNANIYAQIIDDVNGVTLASASTLEKDFEGATGNKEAAHKVGLLVAERAKAKGIDTVIFDRGGYVYHGRVAELAAGAREGGLEFCSEEEEQWLTIEIEHRRKITHPSLSRRSFISTVFPRPSRAAVS